MPQEKPGGAGNFRIKGQRYVLGVAPAGSAPRLNCVSVSVLQGEKPGPSWTVSSMRAGAAFPPALHTQQVSVRPTGCWRRRAGPGEGLRRDLRVGTLSWSSWGCCLPAYPPGRNRGLTLLCVHRSDHRHTHTKTLLTVMVIWKRGDS